MGTIRVARRLTTEQAKDAPNTFAIDDVSVISIDDEISAQPLHVCDACVFCEDVCDQVDCSTCQSKASSMCAPCGAMTKGSRLEPRSYTMCQVRRHNHMGSAWLVAGDVIYDATPYLKTHPGGAECMLRKAGGVQDCTRDLEFHSARGKQLFKKFVVGKVRPCPGCSLYKVDKTEKLKWFLW